MADQRIWRMRKLSQSIDADLAATNEEVEVRFLLNGVLMYARRHPTRALALEEAAARRIELERDGWMAHW